MAVDTSSTPWVVDTASGTPITTSGVRRLWRVKWVGATAAGHVAVIADGAGVVKWASSAPTTSYCEVDYPDEPMTGLTVGTLSSGTLYLSWR